FLSGVQAVLPPAAAPIITAAGAWRRPRYFWPSPNSRLAVGFSGTNPFTPAFHKATGLTPSAYHRSLRQRRYSPRTAGERRKSNTAMGALLLILIACATLGLSIASAHKQSLANARTVDRSGRAALRDRAHGRSDGGGRSRMPRLRRGRPTRGRRPRHAQCARPPHPFPHHHDPPT